MSQSTIHICLAFRDEGGGYYAYAASTMLSIIQNTDRKLAFHIIHDETVTVKALQTLYAVASIYESEIFFYAIKSNEIFDLGLPDTYRFGAGSFYRLYIPSLIDRDIVIYFDCDIICNTNIARLLKSYHETPGKCIGIVQDSCANTVRSLKKMMKKRGFDCNKYFNSGMIIYNTKEVNATFKNFTSTCLRVAKELCNARFIDQDVLNLVFSKISIKWLSADHNYQMNIPGRLLKHAEELHDKILHFSGTKPWDVSPLPAALLFTKYHSQVTQIQTELKII